MHHDESMNPARHEASRASHAEGSNGVVLPVPTPWPMVLALGITLVIAGMVTHWVISLLGLVLLLRSMVGWFFEVLPHEHHASVPIHASERSRSQASAGHARSWRPNQIIGRFFRLKPSA
jgi:hypothetical protein